MKNKAIFLDRDGTINIEKNYLYKIEDFEFIDGVEESIKKFKELGYLVVVVSNQGAISRGLYTEYDVHKLHEYINQELSKHNTQIDAFYYCPHHIEGSVKAYSIECECRKPKIGMFLKAAEELNIDLIKSIMVGDKEIDILAGINTGVKQTFLVRSGHPIDEKNTKANFVVDSLIEVIKFLN